MTFEERASAALCKHKSWRQRFLAAEFEKRFGEEVVTASNGRIRVDQCIFQPRPPGLDSTCKDVGWVMFWLCPKCDWGSETAYVDSMVEIGKYLSGIDHSCGGSKRSP